MIFGDKKNKRVHTRPTDGKTSPGRGAVDGATDPGGDAGMPFVDRMERLQRPARDIVKLMADLPLFEQLTERERASLAELAELARCPGGTVVFESGEEGRYVYCVIQGTLELRTRTGPGIFHEVRTIGVGQVTGLDAMLSGSPYHMKCVALEGTATLRFRSEQMRELLAAGRPFAIKFFNSLCDELGSQIREATLAVVRMLEATSLRPRADDDALYSKDQIRDLLKAP